MNQLSLTDFNRLDMQKHTYPRGCVKVLQALRKGEYDQGYDWVSGDEIRLNSKQRRFTGRISELRVKYNINIIWNGLGGSKSAYRLMTKLEV